MTEQVKQTAMLFFGVLGVILFGLSAARKEYKGRMAICSYVFIAVALVLWIMA